MTTPIQQLEADHQIIEKALRALIGFSRRLERGERMPPEAFERLFGFLSNFADGYHHQKEEQHLFPALASRGLPREHGPIGVMLQEHCSGRALIQHMKRAASAYSNNDPHAVRQFSEAAASYVELLSAHIQKENNVLFHIATELLDARSMQTLQDEFDQAEANLAQPRDKYRQEAEEMEKAWGV